MDKKNTPRVGVVGCGYWGKNHVRNLHALNALAGVCDLTEAGRQLAHELAADVPIYADLEGLLGDDALDGVVIATPAETHYQIASTALMSGLDVLVEKPITLLMRDGQELVRRADEQRRILMVGHILEYHPAILRLRQLIDEGQLGTIRYVYSNRLNLGKIRGEENILWSFAPHDIAVILRLVGKLPFEVVATGGAYIRPNVADVTVTQLLFDNGIRSHIFVSWLHPYKEQRLVVVGSKKMACFDDVAKQLTLYDQRVEWRDGEPLPVNKGGTPVEYSTGEPLRNQCQAFLDAIQTREPPLTDGHSALDVLEVLCAAQRSLATQGQPVQLAMSRPSGQIHSGI